MGNTAKKDARRASTAERQRKALELRKSGATYDQIAKALDGDRSNVRKDVQNAIHAIIEEPAKEVLALELSRLDAMWLGVFPKAKTGDPNAIRAALLIMKRRSDYLGLDAPVKTEHSGAVAVVNDAALLDRLSALAAAEAEGGSGVKADDA